MSQTTFFGLIGKSMVEFAPELKQIVIDSGLSGAIREIVSGANSAALDAGIVNTAILGMNDAAGPAAPFAIAVVEKAELLTLTKQGNSGLYCDKAHLFWAVSRDEERALLPFRIHKRLIVAPNVLEQASNNESYIGVMNMTSVLAATPIDSLTVTHDHLSQVIAHEILGSLPETGRTTEFRERLRYVMRVMADGYKALPRAVRLSQGGLYLRHLELAYERLRFIAANQPDRNLAVEHLADSVFPSFSLPTPNNGSYFDHDDDFEASGEGVGAQIAATIQRHWGGTQEILRSIGHIQLARAVESHPNPAPSVELLNWTWRTYNQQRDADAHGSPLLAWHHFNDGKSNRNLAFVSRSAPDGLSELEFFFPEPDAVQLDGVWSDGSPLVDKILSSKIVIAPSQATVGKTLSFRSPEMTFRVPVVPTVMFSQAQLNGINLKFEQDAPLHFEVTSRIHNNAEQRVEISGRVTTTCEPRGSAYLYEPGVYSLLVEHPPSLFQDVIPTLERHVIMLPPAGSGYLVGRGLTYRGPTQFDAGASPTDQDTDYEWALPDGEEVNIIAWSSSSPAAIEVIDGSVRSLPIEGAKHVIRWVGTLQAEGIDIELVQRGV